MDNKDKTILITGCSSGIGLCVAEGLHQRGYHVIATARKDADVSMLKQRGLESMQLDVTDEDSMDKAMSNILSMTDGKLYALFNNGAYGQTGAVEDIPTDVLREQFNTNVFGWHSLTRRVIPIMRKQGYGRIIQNSSVLGFIALPFRGPYNASKFALEGLSDTLRLELAGSNIFVSLIEPGPIRSRFRDNALAAFERNIDAENSVHREKYLGMKNRLKKEGDAMPFTLPPEAVLKRVIHALESRSPQPRYYVTFPTYLFGTLRRLLPFRWLDIVLLKVSSGGKN
ncbi:MAG: SDR family oxidoreductase [Sulfuriflexus sp.]|nr:SDR family oxidoreductase [Sulfuriflexus sp.]